MIKVSIGETAGGAAAFERWLGLAADVVGDMKPIFDTVVRPFVLEHLEKQFETLGAHGGKPWASLASEPVYMAQKRAMLGAELAKKPLWWSPDRERLRPSLVLPGHKDQRWESSATRAYFGTAVPYASSLINGGIGPYGERYPGRAIFSMSQAQRKGLVTLIQRAVIKSVGADRDIMRDQL